MIKIKGQIQSGIGGAKHTIPLQKPYLKQYVENIENYYDGTINVLLEKPLIIFKPDKITTEIEYSPGIRERFGLVSIKFEIINKTTIDALIYIAYKSPHYANPFYVEIFAPEVDHDKFDYCNIIMERSVRETQAIILE